MGIVDKAKNALRGEKNETQHSVENETQHNVETENEKPVDVDKTNQPVEHSEPVATKPITTKDEEDKFVATSDFSVDLESKIKEKLDRETIMEVKGGKLLFSYRHNPKIKGYGWQRYYQSGFDYYKNNRTLRTDILN